MDACEQAVDAGRLLDRYAAFMGRPTVRRFTAGGGRVFLATEGRDAGTIGALIAAGHRHFAEKYVQEAVRKWPALRRPGLVLHFYGRLQTNKARAASGLFDAIESLDRVRLAQVLASPSRPGPELFLQVNTGREPQKGGVAPEAAETLLARARDEFGLPVAGVMAIPPRAEDPAPHFAWLRRFADRHGLPRCMMGMSADHEAAIAAGATDIRIGRAVFGDSR